MISVIEGQLSIFDLPQITPKGEVKKIIKTVIFKPEERWQANFFNEFKIGKEY